MLVLRRKIGESIVIAGTITISILSIEGRRVKIGISAPPETRIVRKELLHSAPTLQGSQRIGGLKTRKCRVRPSIPSVPFSCQPKQAACHQKRCVDSIAKER
jgi:carbon storage regulator